MHARQIFTDVHSDGDERAKSVGHEKVAEAMERGVEAELVADQADELLRFDDGRELVDSFASMGEGLLDEDVAARAGRGERDLEVEGGRVRDEHGVRPVVQRGVEIVEGSDTIKFVHVARRFDGQVQVDHRARTTDTVGGELEIVPEEAA